jgi:hypothetical protein
MWYWPADSATYEGSHHIWPYATDKIRIATAAYDGYTKIQVGSYMAQ